MPIINADFFCANFPKTLKNANKDPWGGVYYGVPGWRVSQNLLDKLAAKPDDKAAAMAVLNDMGRQIKAGHQQGKAGRPWDICPNIFDTLDRKQPWWGWEFETGWKTAGDRLKAVGHVWDNFDGCMFDGEGEGAYQVEITFMPEEVSKYMDGTATTCNFMRWIDANQAMIYNGGENNVGTHLNISDPRFKSYKDAFELAKFLNRTLHYTRKRNGDRKVLFGRESVYAGFHANSSNDGKNVWLEFKGFRTTYSYEVFQQYIQTALGMQKAVDCYYNAKMKQGIDKPCLANLYEVVMDGAEPELKAFDTLVVAKDAKPMSTRFGGTAAAFGPM